MILAILQARMSSSRLPGKVLKPILGVPMLMRQIERVSRCSGIDQLCVATTTNQSDDSIAELCKEHSTLLYRGDENDVLDRFYQAARAFDAEHIVRLTGDCPLADSVLIDAVVDYYFKGGYDFVSNCIRPKFPDGLDVAVFSRRVLDESWENAKLPSHREHVTLYARESSSYQIGSYESHLDLSHLRWTVDEPADFDFVTRVYEEIYTANPEFSSEEVYDLLERKPELLNLNSKYTRNEGLKKSLFDDQAWVKRNTNET